MKDFDVYGIGAALVDLEAKVSETFLSSNKIRKGVMTLVDGTKQLELLEDLSECGVDVICKSGGSVCNSLIAASNFGSRVFFSGKVADDRYGRLYTKDLQDAGVEFSSAVQRAGITGKCLVMVTPDAERTMNTFLGVSEELSLADIDRENLRASEWLYIEGYLMANERNVNLIIDTARFARENGVKIAISLSDPSIVQKFGDELRELINKDADLIFSNAQEACNFTNSESLEEAAKKLMQYTRSFAITDGPNGAFTYEGKELSHIAGYNIVPVDTTGAGDMFAGCFMNRILRGNHYVEAAKFANFCSARLVLKYGPRLDPTDYREIKRKLEAYPSDLKNFH